MLPVIDAASASPEQVPYVLLHEGTVLFVVSLRFGTALVLSVIMYVIIFCVVPGY